jgi:Peptidase family M48
MIASVYLPLVASLLAVPVLRWAVGRLNPAWASQLIVAAALVLAACSTFALSLLLFAALSLFGPFDRLGHLDLSTLFQLDAVHAPIDIPAGVVLVLFCANGTRVGVNRVRALLAAHRSARETDGDAGGLVVLPDERAVAHAVPGRPGRIVVSTGMLRALDPLERRALIAHERAHLDHGHHRYVVLVDVLAAVNPLLRPLTGAIRYSTERWADEDAAAAVADRTVVARAVGKAALATRAGRPAVALGATGGPVPRRVAALFGAAPERRPATVLLSPTGVFLLVVAGLLAGSIGFSLDALTDLHRVVELAQH